MRRHTHRAEGPSPEVPTDPLVNFFYKFCPRDLPVIARECTMDYVTHVLGLQGWERAHELDDYFCGEEDFVPDQGSCFNVNTGPRDLRAVQKRC